MDSHTKGWWIDTDATRHISKDKSLFITYEKQDGSDKLYMRNAFVEGKGKILLKWTSGKILTLNDVWDVPKIRKNLVLETLLNKNGPKLVFESNKFILIKRGMYVGKDYLSDGMFVLVQMPKNNNSNNINSFAYIVEFVRIYVLKLVVCSLKLYFIQ